MALLANLWQRLVNNWHLKLAAILVAVFLWVYVLNQLDPVGERTANIPVRADNVPQGLELLQVQPETVAVKMRGRSSLLRAALRSLAVSVDVQNRPVGESQVPVAVTGRPPTVDITELTPPTVRVRLDLSVSAPRRVTVEATGLPAEGYQAGVPSASPGNATIHGPAGMVQRVARVVAPVDIGALNASADRDVKVEARDGAGAVVPRVAIDPDRVHVTVPIRAVNVRALPIWPDLGDPPAGYRLARVAVRPSVVILSGPPDRLRAITTVSTQFFDLSSLRGAGTETVPLVVPPGLHVVGPASAEVRVTVEPLPKPGATEASAPEESPPPAAPGGHR
jgi:YbbR domain-containing protein